MIVWNIIVSQSDVRVDAVFKKRKDAIRYLEVEKKLKLRNKYFWMEEREEVETYSYTITTREVRQ